MVADKYSVNKVLSTLPRGADPAVLDQLLICSRQLLNLLKQNIQAVALENNNLFAIVVGKSGSGKTHFLETLYHSIRDYEVSNGLKIAYFPEKEFGVDSFEGFLYRIVNCLSGLDLDKEIREGYYVESLYAIDKAMHEVVLTAVIKKHVKSSQLLVLAENFEKLLDNMGYNDQSKLRAWLYANEFVSILGTSSAYSDNFDKQHMPFYNFFNLYFLEPLSNKDANLFFSSIAKMENNPELIQWLTFQGGPKIDALQEFAHGHPGTLIRMYNYLKGDMNEELSRLLTRLIGDQRQFYDLQLRKQSPLNREILYCLGAAGGPLRGVEVAMICMMDPKTLSKQLSELVRSGWVDAMVDPSDKRNRFYELNDSALRLTIELDAGKGLDATLYFDFLEYVYKSRLGLSGDDHIISGINRLLPKLKWKDQKKWLNDNLAQPEHFIGRVLSLLIGRDRELLMKLLEFRPVIKKAAKSCPVYRVLLKFMQVYAEVVIKGNVTAVLRLPKEQRAFFSKYLVT